MQRPGPERLSDYDYELPEGLVAQEPLSPRDASRLLVVPRFEGAPRDEAFSRLDALLAPGDLLIFNDSRVLPARLLGRKESGGRCELLLVERAGGTPGGGGELWRAIGQSSKPMRPGALLFFGGGGPTPDRTTGSEARGDRPGSRCAPSPGAPLGARVESVEGEGFLTVRFDRAGAELTSALEEVGRVPLPPYIRREPGPADRERYQTVFARVPGSAAAPTAGLHFTPELLRRLEERGVGRAAVTLHVGPGTFLPVRTDDPSEHRMHAERYEVPAATAEAFRACRRRGGRVVAVGTTAVRTLESACDGEGLRVGEGQTSLFIRPGYRFRALDALVTNFHLPRSTLLMLACAFGGRAQVLSAYNLAVRKRYRFFSYGDAMLLA